MDHWQVKQISSLEKILKPNWHFADIGACRGEILDFLQSRLEFGYAFEPDDDNHQFLSSAISKDKLQLIKAAVSDKSGKIRFYRSSSHVGNILGHDMDYKPYESFVEVDSVSLDDFFCNKKVDFIKVDIEGAEWVLFEGAKKLLKEREIIWQVEFHLDEEWHKRKILYENGYKIYDLDFNELPVECSRPYQAILSKSRLLSV